jgi:tape measure domain-containing protein
VIVQELIAKLGFQVDKAGLDKADKGLASLAKNAALMYGAYQLASKAFGLVVESVKGAARLESMNAEFEVMLGNAEAAKYLVQQIQQFAAVTPYHTEELTQNVRLMMAFGQSASQSLAAVKMLGDVAGSDSERLGRLSLAYAQVMAAGKLQGQDLLQFVNAGFNPLQEISQKTGKSLSTLRAEMEKGLISSAMVSEAFASATSKGGRFFGNMEKQSKTLNGLWSTLTDNFQIMMAELGGKLVPFIKDVITALIDMTDGIGAAYRQLGDFFALMFSDGPTAGDIAAGIAASFATIADAIMLAGSLLTGLWSVLQGIFGSVMVLATAVAFAVTAPFVVLLKVVSFLEEKLGTLLRAVGLVKAGNYLTKNSLTANAASESFMAPARFTGAMAGDSFAGAGKSWDKAGSLAAMIGGSKGAPTGSKVALTDGILKALEGKGKVVNSTVNVNNTIHAEGTMLDVLQQQANSVFGLTFQQRLIASAV